MITTEERNQYSNQYSNQGEKLKQIFKKTIGEQLLAERKKKKYVFGRNYPQNTDKTT